MTLYVNNRSAMRFWCMVATSINESTSASSIVSVDNADTSLHSCIAALPDSTGISLPVHLLVSRASQRSKSPGIVCHVRTTPYPAGAFRRFSPIVLVASPELCFFEMASELSFFKLVEFGFILCGTYTLNPDAPSKNNREPLTNKRKLGLFINRMGITRGCDIARKALDCIIEGSASPRETKLALLLCATVKQGGYGFEQPLLNYQIDFTQEERLLYGRDCVVLDLYWKDLHFGIEYDGGKGHSEEEDVSSDRRRDSELMCCGITIIRADKKQLANPYQVYVLARKCARLMGKKMRKPTAGQWENKQKLFNEIMRPSRKRAGE